MNCHCGRESTLGLLRETVDNKLKIINEENIKRMSVL